jgi:glycerol-3-phosphate acyltransferase PlsY
VLGAAIAIVLSFLSGSVPFGLLLARARGIDIRSVGSGNIGAANVARSVGKSTAILVLLLDAAKGALPLLLVPALLHGVRLESRLEAGWLLSLCGFSAIAGHCFTPWLRFRGGKGVATTLGVFLVVDALGIGIAVAVFVVVALATRIASAASLAAALALPLAALSLRRAPSELALAIAALVLVTVLHRENLSRLRSGAEPRF